MYAYTNSKETAKYTFSVSGCDPPKSHDNGSLKLFYDSYAVENGYREEEYREDQWHADQNVTAYAVTFRSDLYLICSKLLI